MITPPNSSAVFIEAHKLGVLEPQFLGVINNGPRDTKRGRKSEFARFARLMHDLGLTKDAKVWGVSYGLNSLGELGLFVHIEHTVRAEAQVPKPELPDTRATLCAHVCNREMGGGKRCGSICARLG